MWNGWWWNGWQWVPLPPPPLPRQGGVAAELGERIGARVIDLVLGTVVVWFLAPALGPDHRPVLSWLLGVVAVAGLETVTTASWSGSVGKLMVGTRVRELDRESGVSWSTAARRAVMTSFIGATFMVVPMWLGSVIAGANRRGFHDRLWGTIVVDKRVATVHTNELAGFDAEARPAPLTGYGPTATIDRRLRARTFRLDSAPVLIVGTAAMLWTFERWASEEGDGWPFVLTTLGFLAAFVVDETIRVHRTGGNAGHHRAGITVVDIATGRPPSMGRSFLRALVLAPLLYIPPLQLVLAFNVFASKRWRGMHDYAGRTAVIARG